MILELLEQALGLYNYWVVIVLMMTGLYVVMARSNLIKKIIGLNIFQVSVIMLYISMGKVEGGTAPVLIDGQELYSNPVPHVLMLTAIVVGISTISLALALVVRLHDAYGTIEEDEILAMLDDEEDLAQMAAPKRLDSAALDENS